MATFIRKVFGLLGTKKDDAPRKPVQQAEGAGSFALKIAVPVEKNSRVPVVSQSTYGNGGVQGLKWYSENLRVDDDGDVAQEFLSEVISKCWDTQNTGTPPRLECVIETKPAVLMGPVCTEDGNVLQHVKSSSGNPRA